MLTSATTPSSSSALSTFCMLVSDFVGLVLEVPSMEPPRRWMPLTPSIVSLTACSVSPWASHLYPSRTPRTLNPWFMPSMVAALMTPLMPGAGPPPTRIASLPRLMLLAISLGQQIADERIFFLQLVDGRVNPRPAEVVDGETLDNFELLA